MECVPAPSDEVAKNAVPLGFNVAVPRMAAPSRKVTAPDGVVLPDCAVTTAVKTTLSPELIWVAEAVNAVEVAATVCVTVTATAGETELELPVLPPYEAVMDCVPAASAEVLKLAVPLAFSVAVPRMADPSRKATVPDGTALPD